MSTATTHQCDRCSTNATVPRTARNKGRQPAGWARIVDATTTDRKAVDLCPRCARGHREWLGIPDDNDEQVAELFDQDDERSDQ